MDRGEESTEMKTMTSDRSAITCSDDAESLPLASSSCASRKHQSKILLKRYLKSPQGKCVFTVVVMVAIGMTCYLMSKIIVGSLFIDTCPLEPFIPIYLVLSATLMMVFVLILAALIIRCRREEDDERVSPVHLIAFVYFFVHLVLQLAGSVCVIRTKNIIIDTALDKTSQTTAGCDEKLLSYSFAAVVFEFILSGLFFCFAAVSLCEVVYVECCRTRSHTKPTGN